TQIGAAGAVANGFYGHFRQGAKLPGQGGGQGGAGGGNQLRLRLPAVNRHPAGFQQLQGGRGRQGQESMGTPDHAAPHRKRRAANLFHAQQKKGGNGTDNIDDGVHGANFMEVDLFLRDAVNRRLGPGQGG